MVTTTHNQSSASSADAPLDLTPVEAIVARLGGEPSALIPILHAIQAHYRYLPVAALRRVCELTAITPAAITGVSTFYDGFRHTPLGQHLIRVCHGTACHVKGAVAVTTALQRVLKLGDGEDTDAEGAFTLQTVACLGCCTLAPVVQIDGITYGHLTPETVPGMLRDFQTRARQGGVPEAGVSLDAVTGAEIRVGVGSCCLAGGSQEVRERVEQALDTLGVQAAIRPVGCVGMCHQTPLVEVVKPGEAPALYARVQADDVEAILRRHFRPHGVWRMLKAGLTRTLDAFLVDERTPAVPYYPLDMRDAPVCDFLGRQVHLATEGAGEMAPLDLDGYRACGGFHALDEIIRRADPSSIIATILESGLRGRGGAGFPAGRKWALVQAAAARPKYVVCNGDEGDPGAFMDRMLLESFPYRVLEGMAIAALAVGAAEGVLYIRGEYPLAVARITKAIAQCEAAGILGSGRALRLRVVEGAGAFVCGEETALLESVEGKRGMPRARPPFPAVAGLWGQPTLINNVETYALVPWIVRHGAGAFRALGTADSAGTKVFALAGKVARGGLIEVPMGISLRAIVEEIGGGVAGGKALKAVQIGGPSGGCIPAHLCDTPVDFEALQGAGAIMGSGGLVVVAEDDCMVDLARYFLSFTQAQSCGKCPPCRVGTRRMLEILERLCTGHGRKGDLDRLRELAETVGRASLCGLGQTAPNPVLTTLRYFADEYHAHLDGRCPAGRCTALVHYRVTEACIGCTICAQRCPEKAIAFTPYERHTIDDARCTRCGICKGACPTGAVVVE
jgi:NADH-quinone oxidoreductase subunit F